MSGEPKILGGTLWQRTSDHGNEYLARFLGKARVIGFRGEPTADGTPTWNLYVQPGREQDEAMGARLEREFAALPLIETSGADLFLSLVREDGSRVSVLLGPAEAVAGAGDLIEAARLRIARAGWPGARAAQSPASTPRGAASS